MLRYNYRMVPRKLKRSFGPGSGPVERMKRLRMLVTALIRHERIESSWAKCDESRGYAERLIDLAIRNGDTHKETMEIADYWLLEKDLVHKLFKVLAPRYKNYNTSFTAIYRLPTEYPGKGYHLGVLELNGNPWPPVLPRKRENRYYLTNILLQEAKKDYHLDKKARLNSSEDHSERLLADASSAEDITGESESNNEQLLQDMQKLNIESDKNSESLGACEQTFDPLIKMENEHSDFKQT